MKKQEFIDKWIGFASSKELAAEMLADLDSLNNWIPVSEKKPPLYRPVLLLIGINPIIGWIEITDNFRNEKYFMPGVSHWQPLPEAP